MHRPGVIALFGPTGVGKTAVASRSPGGCGAAASDPVAVSADALQVYARPRDPHRRRRRPAQHRELEHRLVSFLPVDARFSVAEYAALAHAEIDGLLAAGAHADRRRRHRPLPARRADRARPAPAAPARRARALERPSSSAAARRRCTPCWPRARRGPPRRIDPADRHRIVRALELAGDRARSSRPGRPSQLWSRETRHPTRLIGLVMEREALYAPHRRPRRRDGRRRRDRRGARRPRAPAPRRPRARRSASTSCSPATSRR